MKVTLSITHRSKICYPLSVCFCSSGVLLQWLRPVDVAAPADDHPGLHWNTLLLRGGEDAEFLCRLPGILEKRQSGISINCFLGQTHGVRKNNPASFTS